MTENTFTGKTVVITNAGGEPGLSIARAFGRVGAQVILTDADAASGEGALKNLRGDGLSASFELLDVRDPLQSLALVEKVEREGRQIDVWVNRADLVRFGPAEDLTQAAWEDTLSVVLSGPFYCSQAAGRHMLRQGGGVIINVASVNGYQAIEGYVANSAAQAGLIMLTQAMGIEWAKRGVRVTGIATITPGTVDLETVRSQDSTLPDTYKHRTPLRRLATDDDIADAVLYLASDEASFITAEILRVDGGWLAYQLF